MNPKEKIEKVENLKKLIQKRLKELLVNNPEPSPEYIEEILSDYIWDLLKKEFPIVVETKLDYKTGEINAEINQALLYYIHFI